MIPLRDNIPSRTVPIVNFAIIGITTLVFFVQLADQRDGRAELVESFGMIPKRVFHPDQAVSRTERVAMVNRFGEVVEVVEQSRELAPTPFNPWLTLLTCIFLHGGWMHFLGNMWFLYIFGDNVEDRIGHFGYILFYMLAGIAASAAHLLSAPASDIPTVGASGAIAGVMGAYFLLYPRAKVVSIIFIVFFIEVLVLPAPVFLAVWFIIQFFQGLWSITSVQTTGVAWWAHIGGFVLGFLVAAVLRGVGETRPPVETVRPQTDRTSLYRYHR